jgi:large subunit ribosomal protein L31
VKIRDGASYPDRKLLSNPQRVAALVFSTQYRLHFLASRSTPKLRFLVKTDIHPVYATATVKCACGNTFQTRSTSAELHTDVCAACHPFYTGKQKFLDTAGRIDRFRQKFGKKA